MKYCDNCGQRYTSTVTCSDCLNYGSKGADIKDEITAAVRKLMASHGGKIARQMMDEIIEDEIA